MKTIVKTGLPNPTPQNTQSVVTKLVGVVDQLQGVRGEPDQRAVRLFELQELENRLGSTEASSGGGATSAGNDHMHTQNNPASTWTINHNLNRRVVVQAFTPGGVQMLAQVLNVSFNQSQVLFDAPFSGYALVK